MSEISEVTQLELGAQEKFVEKIYVLSSNYSLPMLLARGCILPPICGESTDIQFLDEFKDQLPWRKGKLPKSWADRVEASTRNAFPIAIGLKSDIDLRY